MNTKENTEQTLQPEVAAQIQKALGNDRMLFRSFYMIITTAIMFGAMGGLVGWVLAILLPGYFRNVYDAMDSEIWQVGVGLGISRGLICGVLIGCSVLVATAWYRSRMAKVVMSQLPDYSVDSDE